MMSFLAFVIAISFGFAAANLVRGLYYLFFGEALGYRHLITPGFFQPVRALLVVAGGPGLLLSHGVAIFRRSWGLALLIIAFSSGWSFMMGVVILSKFLGL